MIKVIVNWVREVLGLDVTLKCRNCIEGVTWLPLVDRGGNEVGHTLSDCPHCFGTGKIRIPSMFILRR